MINPTAIIQLKEDTAVETPDGIEDTVQRVAVSAITEKFHNGSRTMELHTSSGILYVDPHQIDTIHNFGENSDDSSRQRQNLSETTESPFGLTEELILLGQTVNNAVYDANRYNNLEFEHKREDALSHIQEAKESTERILERYSEPTETPRSKNVTGSDAE